MGLKVLFFLALLTLFFGLGFSATEYHVSVEGETVKITALLTIQSNPPVNYWDINWIIPANMTLGGIQDTIGDIEDYSLNGRELSIRTNKGSKRSSEVIEIELFGASLIDSSYSPLKIVDLSLPGFPQETTEVKLIVDGILGASSSFGFSEKFNENGFVARGSGPVNIRTIYSLERPQTEHFFVTPFYDLSIAEEHYSTPLGVIGQGSLFPYFSLVVLPDSEYDSIANEWSEGIYRGAGLILVRESIMKKKENVSIILHEATHGINEQFLEWDQSEQQWFDEGIAKYVEFLANKELKIPSSQIFGDTFTFEDGKKKFIMPPRQNPSDLLDYYDDEETFMYSWNTRDPETREFGYAFSELLVRDYVLENGMDSFHPVYDRLSKIDEISEDSFASTSLILNTMDSDMMPCYDSKRDEILECLEEVQARKYSIPDFDIEVVPESELEIVEEIQEIEEEIIEEPLLGGAQKPSIWDRLVDFFRSLFASLDL